jgi:hypothetical protein
LNILNLTDSGFTRVFVVGSLNGDYFKLIDLLYEQQFTYSDGLVLCGNFVNQESDNLFDIFHFLKNNKNCFSVLGKNEVDFVEAYKEDKLPEFLQTLVDTAIIEYLETLPLAIQFDNFLVVNAGIEPSKELPDQDDKVFYSIPLYDRESRYYQFENPESKSWFDFTFDPLKICFTNNSIEETTVEAGYNLKSSTSNLVCLIITPQNEVPVIISVEDNILKNNYEVRP